MSLEKLPKTQDPSSVFFIHPNENPGVSLVYEKFAGENYSAWKRSMIIALAAKNKLCFVDGNLEKRQTTDTDFKEWERCNNLIISYLLKSLDVSISRSALYFSIAREIWKDLE